MARVGAGEAVGTVAADLGLSRETAHKLCRQAGLIVMRPKRKSVNAPADVEPWSRGNARRAQRRAEARAYHEAWFVKRGLARHQPAPAESRPRIGGAASSLHRDQHKRGGGPVNLPRLLETFDGFDAGEFDETAELDPESDFKVRW